MIFSHRHRTTPTTADREAPIKADLVDLLYASTFNVVFISIAAAAFCGFIAVQVGDAVFVAFAVSALVIGAGRFAVDRAYHRHGDGRDPDRWERRHAIGSLAFSALVAAIGAYTFGGGPEEAQLFSVVFLLSYCTGVLSRLSVRPRLAIACIKLAALPCVAALLLHPILLYEMLGLFILAMSFASLQLIQTTYRLTFDVLVTRAELAALAGSDPLTGLANRFSLDRNLRGLFADGTVRAGQAVAVHFIDLDHFKAANDTFGHAVGDAVLTEVARRITALLPDGAFAARRGGDEFLVVQPHLSNEIEAERLARRMTVSLSAPYAVQDQTVVIGASVGVALTDDPSDTVQGLIIAADRALYEAKRKGRGGVEFYDPRFERVA